VDCPLVETRCTVEMRAGRQPGDPAAGETQDVVAVGWEKEELASGPQGSGL